jgi:hypothetical protein
MGILDGDAGIGMAICLAPGMCMCMCMCMGMGMGMGWAMCVCIIGCPIESGSGMVVDRKGWCPIPPPPMTLPLLFVALRLDAPAPAPAPAPTPAPAKRSASRRSSDESLTLRALSSPGAAPVPVAELALSNGDCAMVLSWKGRAGGGGGAGGCAAAAARGGRKFTFAPVGRRYSSGRSGAIGFGSDKVERPRRLPTPPPPPPSRTRKGSASPASRSSACSLLASASSRRSCSRRSICSSAKFCGRGLAVTCAGPSGACRGPASCAGPSWTRPSGGRAGRGPVPLSASRGRKGSGTCMCCSRSFSTVS